MRGWVGWRGIMHQLGDLHRRLRRERERAKNINGAPQEGRDQVGDQDQGRSV